MSLLSVGCGTLIHTVDGRIVNIEGDPRSPLNQGTLCPKGAAIFQLHVNPNRPTQVLHRAAGAADWEVWNMERAMSRIAELTKKTRDETFIEKLANGKLVNMTPAIFAAAVAAQRGKCNAWSVPIAPCPTTTSGCRSCRKMAAPTLRLTRAKRCLGYVKTFTTLQGSSPANVMVDDLASVDLDIAAVQQGYRRPAAAAFAFEVEVVSRPNWSERMTSWIT